MRGPMTGPAKQSISPLAEVWIASELTFLAMTMLMCEFRRIIRFRG
jgi:hypothetical protein